MTKRSAAALLCLLLGLAGAGPSRAWGELGHRSVADLAEALIQPETRQRLAPILAHEKAQRLADMANWADAHRENPAFKFTASYHFINFPRGQCSFSAKTSCDKEECIVSAIERFRRELADSSLPIDKRGEALKFLVHLIGDLHQPLHAGWFDDWGGNTFQLSIKGEGSNLHKLWDVELPKLVAQQAPGTPLDETLRAISLPWRADGAAADWAVESCQLIGRAGIYPAKHKLSQTYLDQQQPLAAQRMAIAGRRLAHVLDQAMAAAALSQSSAK